MDALQIRPTLARRLTRAIVGLSLFTSCLLSQASFAAVQGSTGTTSTASIDIIYTQGILVRIAGLTDFHFGTWSGTGPLIANDNICIARNAIPLFGTDVYRIRASGDGTGVDPSAFTLSNGSDQIHYNAYFNDSTGLAGRTQLTPGVTLTGQRGFGLSFFWNLLFGCAWQNANISIEVPESELTTTPAGNYAGTLTLLLIPE